jgi:nitrate reductase (NAD(P)H)
MNLQAWTYFDSYEKGFHELALGDTIQIKGPVGSFIWEGDGIASWRGVKRKARNLGLVCAGSG